MNKKEIKEHLQWLKKFTDCKEVKSVPSSNRKKVQRKPINLSRAVQLMFRQPFTGSIKSEHISW